MSRIDVLRPFIEKNLAALLEAERVAPDGDGEYTFPHGSAEVTLRLLDAPMPLLQFSAVLVSGMKKKARVLEAVNDVNAAELGIRLFRFEDLVIAAWEVPGRHARCPPVHGCVPPFRRGGRPARHHAGPQAGRQDRARRRGRGGGGCLGGPCRAC